ncbi:MAG: methionyl-tRNA formyltransferase [Thermodesulfobacteriota bacterium]
MSPAEGFRPYRILFYGTPSFAVPSLAALLTSGEEVVALVTRPDKPKGRGKHLASPPTKLLAEQHGIPVLQPTRIRDEAFREAIRALVPDLAVVAAYGRILPGELIRLPPLGTINVHGSILPRYRGAAPVQWAIIRGETETGVTIMQMDEGLDTGDILHIERLAIGPGETAGQLAERMATLGAQALIKSLDLLRRGELKAVRQDDRLATLAPPLAKEMAAIDWTRPAGELANLIRGLDPWPGCHTLLAGRRLRLFCPRALPATSSAPPGTLLRAAADGLLVATGDGALLVAEVQLEGGTRQPVDVFLCGHPLAAGSRLPS